MQRFVSKRSSSSVDLNPSSRDDMRTERAAIALSVGLSWPPAKRRSSCGNVLFRSTSSTTVSSRMVSAYSGRAGGNQETSSPDRSLTRRSPTSALPVPLRPPHPLQPLHSLKTGAAAARQNAAKSTSTPSCPTGSSACWTSGGHNGGGACSGAWVRSSDFAPGCSTGSTRTLPTAGNGGRQQQHHGSAGRPCSHPQT